MAPRDPQSGIPTGRRMHKPFMLTKELDPLAVSVKKAVRKAVAKAGEDVLHDKDVKDTMKNVVKKEKISVESKGRDYFFKDGVGEALTENDRSDLRRDRFGFVFQTFNLIPVLTAEENVAYPMAIARVPAQTRREAGSRRS